jgi:hypothetical protein
MVPTWRCEVAKVMLPTLECPSCGKAGAIEVEEEDLKAYNEGIGEKRLIQNAFPYLTLDQREQLMTGYDAACWTALWKDTELETED